MLRILNVRKLWVCNFLWGLAPGRLDGFLIRRLRRSENHSTVLMRSSKGHSVIFWGENAPALKPFKKNLIHLCPSVKGNSKWQTQNPSKSFQIPPFKAKRQQYTAGKVIQGFYIFSDIQCIAIDEANLKW